MQTRKGQEGKHTRTQAASEVHGEGQQQPVASASFHGQRAWERRRGGLWWVPGLLEVAWQLLATIVGSARTFSVVVRKSGETPVVI